jgi:sec-independent protein translocase protein TatA
MGSFSLWHWLIVLAIVLVLFGGGGKIPRLMKDLGQGITAFKKGLKNDEKPGETQASSAAGSASGDDKHGMIDRG